MDFPKISIVTPSFNQGRYLEETVLSVLNQEYPNLEYIIIDGGSTDNSIEIIRKYERYLSYWVSEPDKGMYDAIQKGFEKSHGEIMSWINSDDMLAKNSLFTVAEVFSDFSFIEWLSGIPNQIDESGRSSWVGGMPRWNKFKYLLLDFKYIQQEGIFWRRCLWEKSGNSVSTNLKLAGDLELWSRFFQHAELYFITGILGTFRMRSINQKSLEYLKEYHEEAIQILKQLPKSKEEEIILTTIKSKLWFLLQRKSLRPFRKLLKHDKMEWAMNKYPPFLTFDRIKQRFKI